MFHPLTRANDRKIDKQLLAVGIQYFFTFLDKPFHCLAFFPAEFQTECLADLVQAIYLRLGFFQVVCQCLCQRFG